MKTTIKRIVLAGTTTPARVDLETGVVYVNTPYFDVLPDAYQEFILAHEEGHFVLKTYDEFKADEYAFDQLAGKKPYSLLNMLNTLVHVLPMVHSEQKQRVVAMYRNIMLFNFQKTGDKKYLEEYNRYNVNFLGNGQYGYDEWSNPYNGNVMTFPTQSTSEPTQGEKPQFEYYGQNQVMEANEPEATTEPETPRVEFDQEPEQLEPEPETQQAVSDAIGAAKTTAKGIWDKYQGLIIVGVLALVGLMLIKKVLK